MPLDFIPKQILKTKDKDGNIITTEVYTTQGYISSKMWLYFGIAILVCVIAPVASSILLVFYCIDRNADPQPIPFNLYGFLISLYFLVDFYNGWLLTTFVSSILGSDTEMKISVYANAATLVINFVCLLNGERIYESVDRSKSKLFLVILGSFVVLFFTAMLVMNSSASDVIHQQAAPAKTATSDDNNNSEKDIGNQSNSTTDDAQNSNAQVSPPIDTTKSVESTTSSSYQQQSDSGVTSSKQYVNNDVESKENVIEAYMKAQDDRDFNAVSEYYAPAIRRNWEMYNPSLSQIYQVISHLWSVTSSSNQIINSIKSFNDSTIIADVTNTYVTRKLGLTKSKEYNIYFVLDGNNKIVETYGYEK
jgi:hypothetical protein